MKGLVAVVVALLASVTPARAAEQPERELVVFGAASLREAFGTIAERFDRRHPGVRVAFNLAGSQELAAQILNGAPADVFASADPANMAKLVKLGLVERPRLFARNAPVLVVKPRRVRADPLAGRPSACGSHRTRRPGSADRSLCA